VDEPKDKTFRPFGDARHKIEGEVIPSREMYFATYQAIAKDARRPGLYREYPRDFFDLVIVDECHRGSAKDESPIPILTVNQHSSPKRRGTKKASQQ